MHICFLLPGKSCWTFIILYAFTFCLLIGYLLQPLHSHIHNLKPDACGFFWHVNGWFPFCNICNIISLPTFVVIVSVRRLFPCFSDIQDIARLARQLKKFLSIPICKCTSTRYVPFRCKSGISPYCIIRNKAFYNSSRCIFSPIQNRTNHFCIE